MENAFLVKQGLDVSEIDFELYRQPTIWNVDRERTGFQDSPHRESDDIWVRYNDKSLFKDDLTKFNEPHFPIWYPAYYKLPSLSKIIFDLMAAFNGEHLGGVLITRLKPGCKIYSHTDTGWHVDFYDKFNVIIKGEEGSAFIWENGDFMPGRTGDVYHFFNNAPHELINDSDEDYIVMAVCIRTHRYGS